MKTAFAYVAGFACLGALGSLSAATIRDAAFEALIKAQHRRQPLIADCTQYARTVARKHRIFPSITDRDTLFIVERVAEAGSPLLVSYLWSSKRDCVVKYKNWPAFKSETLPYKTFDDPLRLLTERMDTTKILQSQPSVESPRVFISQIQRKGLVKTFYFSDITPAFYEYR